MNNKEILQNFNSRRKEEKAMIKQWEEDRL